MFSTIKLLYALFTFQPNEVVAAVQQAMREFGKINILVNGKSQGAEVTRTRAQPLTLTVLGYFVP